MKSCGFLTTIMNLRKVKEWWFNIPLLVFQLWFLIVGTAYGKIKWPEISTVRRWFCAMCAASAFAGLLLAIIAREYPFIVGFFIVFILWTVEYRGISWPRVWQAAKVSHVRLCLRQAVEVFPTWEYISFSYPVAKLDYWTMTMVAHDRFKYYDPTFEPSDEFIAAMIEYAYDQVGKRYDWLQLILGYPANFVLWLFWPPWWGKEKIRWFNLPGGKEVCSSGWVADLRWGERDFWDEYTRDVGKTFGVKSLKDNRRFFPGYHTAVIPPCLAPLSENWREVK